MINACEAQVKDAYSVFAGRTILREPAHVLSAKQVLDEIARRNISRTDVARVLGISQPNATKLWKPDSRTGKTRALRTDEARLLIDAFKLFEEGQPIPEPEQPVTRTIDAGETAEVQRLDLSYAMGDGTNLDDYAGGEPFKFDLGFLRQFTITPPSRLRIVDGIGDSMFPTIHDRDLLLIDINQRELNAQDRIWAMGLFGAGAVKRLRLVGPDRVLVISDNPDVADQEVSRSDIVLSGRVVGSIKRH